MRKKDHSQEIKGFYETPEEMAEYISKKAIYLHIAKKTNENLLKQSQENQNAFITDLFTYLEKTDKIGYFYRDVLKKVKICDNCCGSGVFLLAAARILFDLSKKCDDTSSTYLIKKEILLKCLYGVDIQKENIDRTKSRLLAWVNSEQSNEKESQGLEINLDHNIKYGNALIGFTRLNESDYFKECSRNCPHLTMENLISHSPFYWVLEYSEVFDNDGFDIIIGNPPYISNKKTSKTEKDLFEFIYGSSDDLYKYFFLLSFKILKKGGILAYITSNTYFTLESKRDLREILQSKLIHEIELISHLIFKNVEVETAIIIVENTPIIENYKLKFIDGRSSSEIHAEYLVEIQIFKNALNKTFFLPDKLNMIIYMNYNDKLKHLFTEWWDKISNSRKISKNWSLIDMYRKKLQTGDLTLIGLVTEGGQGLATSDNGKYVAVRSDSKLAEHIKKSRPRKLFQFIDNAKSKGFAISELPLIESKEEANIFLNTMDELQIELLFDSLREKYGQQIFGRGYLYRIINPKKIAKVETLSLEEKEDGISINKPHYISYDKGDKEGNKWYVETPYYISWSKENVQFFKTNPKARWQGFNYFFKEGFCWSNILNPHAKMIKCRYKSFSIHDVASMALLSVVDKTPNEFLVSVLNSLFAFHFLRTFINNTVNMQINDIRKIPIIVPSKQQLNLFTEIFGKAIVIKKNFFLGVISPESTKLQLQDLQHQLNEHSKELYNMRG